MLKVAWPDYRKPMTKIQLARRIDLDAVQRAAAAEAALSAFLREINLISLMALRTEKLTARGSSPIIFQLANGLVSSN
jgi:hypothetical protein